MDEWKYIDKALKCYAEYLEDELPIEDLLADMKNENLISENEYREINSMQSRREKNRTIRKILKSRDSQYFTLFCKFLCMHSNNKVQRYGWILRNTAINERK